MNIEKESDGSGPRLPIVARSLVFAVATSIIVAPTAAAELEEIIVTAQRKEENIQDVPASVSAFRGEQIQEKKIRNGLDIADYVPNVHMLGSQGMAQINISIRGISTSDFTFGQSFPIAIYSDENYVGVNTLSAGLQLFDLDRVEVLRGPQGTLYGKNTTGGAVKFISKAPSLKDSDGYVTVGAGNFGRWEAQAAYGTPIIEDKLAARVAINYLNIDGYVENKTPGQHDLQGADDFAARAIFLFAPNDRFTARLQLYTSNMEGATAAIIVDDIDPLGVGFLGYRREGLDLHETEATATNNNFELDEVSFTMDWLAEGFKLTSITSYDEANVLHIEDGDGLHDYEILYDDFLADTTWFAQELRFTSQFEGPFNIIAGAYYANEKSDIANRYRFYFELGTPDCTDFSFFVGCFADNRFEMKKETWALFADMGYALTDALKITFGVRFTHDDARVSDYTGSFGGTSNQIQGVLFGPIDDQFDTDDLSPKVGLEYRFPDNSLAYFTYSQGYRGGTYNTQALFFAEEVEPVNPEEIDAFEIGYKREFFEGSWRMNVAAFHYDYQNQQLQIFNGLTGQSLLQNAASSSSDGAELELYGQPLETLTINVGIGWLDANYDELTVAFDGNGNAVDGSGNRVLNAPEFDLNVGFKYGFRPLPIGTISVSGDAVFTDNQNFQADNTPATGITGYWLVNGRIELVTLNDSATVGFWVRNMFDEETYVNKFDLRGGFGYTFNAGNTPRTFGADLNYRF